jgi:hypothetical protein
MKNWAFKNQMTTRTRTRNIVPASYERIRVECYSGYKANERPVAFTYQGRRREVEEIVDRWYEGGVDPGRPTTNYFKVKMTDGDIFTLRYLSLFDAWSVRT